ncbi:DNA helicase/exodeoxyribonuclease V subunit A [Novosphingobium kunmingense]|uniref:DNA 3'-5' helicase n=1 Tax=Novosphingobium kunmingense TaxID=1211806 RepID=A0A2N0I398_9SPHN|nr:double-strand break repair helicase AddA [Novosphingobium kunmingense]PKB25662.1 DNA helicase/exodeoxyribonuclease V subunit A [Novosphingobium kunmingense]
MSRVFPLTDEQRPAVDPGEVVWLSASAGTGKTQVLSARVLRLLLQDNVAPSQILCLTFTKAGAAEMATRINEVLARWVRLDDNALFRELEAIGARSGPEARARARTLFASVLDCPGGGLRIDTIHAFAQWLLSAFPHEAGLAPGTRAMEDRDRQLLMREVLGGMLVEAEERGDAETLHAVAVLSERLGPDSVEAYLLRCAEAHDLWHGPGAWQPPMDADVRRLIGLPADAESAAGLCADGVFDTDALELCLAAYGQWSVKTGQDGRAVISAWLAADAEERLLRLAELSKVLFTQKDAVKNGKSLVKFEEGFEQAGEAVLRSVLAVRERQALIALAAWLAPALELGRRFALAWDEAKAREGLIDFDDQIRQAAHLLQQSDLAGWIRYKLDRRFDHVLVDEAQDTNAAQWHIIDALIGDFFSGEGLRGDVLRTLFVVGDYKQAIFRFQGTSPENFARAKERVRAQMRLAENVFQLRESRSARELQDLGLSQSFRTSRDVLEFVDLAVEAIGFEAIGLDQAPDRHRGEDRPGLVTLWRVVAGREEDEVIDEEGEDTWFARSDRRLADRIAQQVKHWIDHGFPLVKGEVPGTARRARAGDVMVLVRKRKELAGLIVGRLHAAGVPVAGVDRLRLAAPLAVRDLMAAVRFAAQPFDDLNLACLLTSPLLGWSQDDLLTHGYRDGDLRLWEHLRRSREPVAEQAMVRLFELLRLADYEPPLALLHWILTGPWQGRRALVARLGAEANDPIDELLNAASSFAGTEVPSLQGFIRWFDAGEGELKREAGKQGDQVRVMTVHGSKGLQAPIVILADAADDPERSLGSPLELKDPASEWGGEPRAVPLPSLRKAERVGRIAQAHDAARTEERQEHWRLLYVAMTRAEEALFIAGALGPRETEPAADSWYARLQGLFGSGDWLDDPLWGARLEHGAVTTATLPPPDRSAAELALLEPWLERPAPAEPRPSRPLAPSSLGEDLAADPPYPPGAGGEAARRGVLLHRLLERLPDVPPPEREAAALAWLARAAGDLDHHARTGMAASAIRVLGDPAWAELFAPGSLAEVPIAATVGGQVIAGTIDRVVIGADRIRLIDFKTARRPPASLDEVPVAILRQMAAYAAALEAVYPGRKVEAALLYTQTPRLLVIPTALLAIHKQALTGT